MTVVLGWLTSVTQNCDVKATPMDRMCKVPIFVGLRIQRQNAKERRKVSKWLAIN